ncbi:hypothetical protein, partial [Vreelandella rituensis]|uniref:hypothetical protein n=1 Tax=Vreelandella rituensis TaxID=2282306 RepID=UPI0039EEC792
MQISAFMPSFLNPFEQNPAAFCDSIHSKNRQLRQGKVSALLVLITGWIYSFLMPIIRSDSLALHVTSAD